MRRKRSRSRAARQVETTTRPRTTGLTNHSEQSWRSIALLVIALSASLAYANTLTNDLIFDDLDIIPTIASLHAPSDLGGIFGGAYRFSNKPATLYRTLTVWTLAANSRLNSAMGRSPVDPLGFHLVNLILHAAVSVILYLWLLSFPLPSATAFATGLIFAVHPIHTEAVAQIVGRAEILAGLFGVLFLFLHRGRHSPPLCALAYLLALWSKESAIAFLPLALLMDLTFPSGLIRFARYGWYSAVVAGWLGLRSVVLAGQPQLFPFVDNPLTTVSLTERLFTIARVQLEYLRLQLFPLGQSSDYSYNQIPVISTAANPYVLGGFVLVAAATAVAWKNRKAHPVLLFTLAGYAILFAPTSNAFLPIGTIMAERLAYSPSLMIALALCYGGVALHRRVGATVVAIFVAVVVLLGGLTVARNRTWSNELTFFQTQVDDAPNSAKAHYGLGTALAFRGNQQAAIAEYQRAIAILPYYPEAFYNLANALRVTGADPAQVIDAYRSTLRFNPNDANATANLALFLLENGRVDEARPLVQQLARLDPSHRALEILRRVLP